MKRYCILCIMIHFIIVLALFAQKQTIDQMLQSKHDESSLLVRFHPETTNEEKDMLFSKLNTKKIEALKLVPNLYTIYLNERSDLRNTLTFLNDSIEVMYSHPNYIIREHATIPNDTYYASNLWGLPKIQAPEAWDTRTDGSTIIIAVLDSGILYTHEDLVGNIWENLAEKNGTSNVDDDGNGYIDDIYGYDFVKETGDPVDERGHGTLVAGIIGAVGNNSRGVTGVCWTAKMMAVKCLDENGSGTVSQEIKGIEYAIANGAKIINMSLGAYENVQAEYDAILEAKNKGILCVASSGNDGNDNDTNPMYPASHSLNNIASVGASDEDDALAEISNYGYKSVDLLAPGMNIRTTFIDSERANDTYADAGGTSMAAPFVSGAAALLWAQYPNETYGQILHRIYETVDKIDGLPVRTGGRLNLYKAMNYQWESYDDFSKGSGGCAVQPSSSNNLGNLLPYIIFLIFAGWKTFQARSQQ